LYSTLHGNDGYGDDDDDEAMGGYDDHEDFDYGDEDRMSTNDTDDL
jgi:hypothetical protein